MSGTLVEVDFCDGKGAFIQRRRVHARQWFDSRWHIECPADGGSSSRTLLAAHDGRLFVWLNENERMPMGEVLS